MVQPTPAVDRYALGIAVLSAFTFVATMTLICAVVSLFALVLLSETRRIDLASTLGSGPGYLSPLATPPQAQAVAAELPTASPLPPTAQPTLEPTPTATAVATATLVTDLPTPNPQLPPTPTVAGPVSPLSPLSLEDANCQARALQPVSTLTNAVNTLLSLLAVPQLMDENWKTQVRAQISIIDQVRNELNATRAPPLFASGHDLLLNATTQCLTGAYDVQQAINANDVNFIQQGVTEINSCLPSVTNASSQLSGVQGSTVLH